MDYYTGSELDNILYNTKKTNDCISDNLTDDFDEIRASLISEVNKLEDKDLLEKAKIKLATHMDPLNGLKTYLETKFNNEALKIIEENNISFNSLFNEVKEYQLISGVNEVNKEYLNELINDKKNENREIENLLDDEKKLTYTNERKALYKSNQNIIIGRIKTFLIIFYYIIFVLYVFFDFMMKKKYTDYKNILLLILFAFIPLIIINFTFSISNIILKFYSNLSKNLKTEDI